MDRYEVMAGKMAPLTDGAHRKWGFTGKESEVETAIPRLRELFARADEVIGYNVGFDLGFLSAVGVRPREDSIITDTMFLFKQLMGRRYKLTDAADHIGYEWTGRAHGSLADALATLAVQEWLESR